MKTLIITKIILSLSLVIMCFFFERDTSEGIAWLLFVLAELEILYIRNQINKQ